MALGEVVGIDRGEDARQPVARKDRQALLRAGREDDGPRRDREDLRPAMAVHGVDAVQQRAGAVQREDFGGGKDGDAGHAGELVGKAGGERFGAFLVADGAEIARIAAEPGAPLDEHHGAPQLDRRFRRREARDAAADDQQIDRQAFRPGPSATSRGRAAHRGCG